MFITWTLPAEHHKPHTDLPREQWTLEDWRIETARLEAATRLLTELVSEHLRELNQRRARAGFERRLRYVWVAEAHRSGVPHAHAIVLDLALAEELRAERAASGAAPDAAGRPSWSWLASKPAGFGRMDASLARSQGAVVSYLAKLAGEVSKGQGALTLGRHQRTYAASRGMLAPRRKSEHWTGTLVTRHGALVRRPAEPDDGRVRMVGDVQHGFATMTRLVNGARDVVLAWYVPLGSTAARREEIRREAFAKLIAGRHKEISTAFASIRYRSHTRADTPHNTRRSRPHKVDRTRRRDTARATPRRACRHTSDPAGVGLGRIARAGRVVLQL